MNKITQTIRNYAELSRLSNIPTIVTNVLVGVALGRMIVIDDGPGEYQPMGPLILAIIASAMMLLYIAGMVLWVVQVLLTCGTLASKMKISLPEQLRFCQTLGLSFEWSDRCP